MHLRYLPRNGTDLVLMRCLLRHGVLASLLTVLGMQSAAAQEVRKCALTEPKFHVSGSAGVFEITIDCGAAVANAKAFPSGEGVLAGLSLYADAKPDALMEQGTATELTRTIDAAPAIRTALMKTTASKSVAVAGGPKWIVLKDEDVESFDFPVQTIKLDSEPGKVAVKFQAEVKAFAGKRHMLFAVWPKSESKPCDRDNKFARSGCKSEGYVIGDGAGVHPIASYPGMEINEFKHPNEGWTTERWIVERFR